MENALFFVSKRLQKVAAAIICLMVAQAFVLASCDEEPIAMAARVAISR